jgi:TnpA family transposase
LHRDGGGPPDSHGQSEVAFAFCRLLGFQLLPRLKNIGRQRLYRPAAGQPDAYPRLQHALSRPINWELICQQYDEMVKYATALRLGTAETEAILRRFTRANVQHPTYRALAELGKAIKTIFLCRYLNDEALRREVNEGSMSSSTGTAPMTSCSSPGAANLAATVARTRNSAC